MTTAPDAARGRGGSPGRSVLAVVAGFAGTIVLSVAIDALVRAAAPGAFGADGHTPNRAVLAFGVFYTLLSAAVGGWLAGVIARRAEVMHAVVLGTLGALATLAIIVAVPAVQRTAGQFVAAMLVIPATVLGGWWSARRRGAA